MKPIISNAAVFNINMTLRIGTYDVRFVFKIPLLSRIWLRPKFIEIKLI